MSGIKLEVYVNDLERFVSIARGACKCIDCSPPSSDVQALLDARSEAPRPKSCLAPTILKQLLEVAPCAEIAIEPEPEGASA